MFWSDPDPAFKISLIPDPIFFEGRILIRIRVNSTLIRIRVFYSDQDPVLAKAGIQREIFFLKVQICDCSRSKQMP